MSDPVTKEDPPRLYITSRLKHAAQEVIRTDGGMTACKHFHSELDPNRVLALVECAEFVRWQECICHLVQWPEKCRRCTLVEKLK